MKKAYKKLKSLRAKKENCQVKAVFLFIYIFIIYIYLLFIIHTYTLLFLSKYIQENNIFLVILPKLILLESVFDTTLTLAITLPS